jgi:hypothetical protein
MLQKLQSVVGKIVHLRPYEGDGEPSIINGIFEQIRGSGIVTALFSKDTPARTIGSIFFELGVASTLGKPAIIVWSGDNFSCTVPGDIGAKHIVHLEDPGWGDTLKGILQNMFARAEDYSNRGNILVDGLLPSGIKTDIDLELAFEYFKRSALIRQTDSDGEPREIAGIEYVLSRIKEIEDREVKLNQILRDVTTALDEVAKFFKDAKSERRKNLYKKTDNLLNDLRSPQFGPEYRNPELKMRRRLAEAASQFVTAYRSSGGRGD